MYETPPSLKDVCLDFICGNLDSLIEHRGTTLGILTKVTEAEMTYANKEMVLPGKISELLLTTLSMRNKLDDVTMGMFDHRHCKLR
jgi:hypothetical protein